ncbi:ABC transporter permease [Treponema sp.]|uniref:ABC transporter permease n=1 Tax=Treponema sp. TaxID=166 RepID=UPI00298D6CBA|nr:ABC transporter permease subunit [Treponema sp.]MCR5614161.1 ABC transporter permease subunit [Treponema sp.]
MNENVKRIFTYALPFLAAALSAVLYFTIPESGKQKVMDHPYYMYFLLAAVIAIAVSIITAIFLKDFRRKLEFKLPLYAGIILFLAALNTLVCKTRLLPVLYFPSLDKICGLLWTQKFFLIKNLVFSLGLLVQGFLFGLVTGFFTGLALGYNRHVGYWLNPVTKFLGPVPTTAWIPLALSVFPTTHGANVFLIAFAVWFPVTLMTASGIQSVNKTFFEVSETLGAKTFFKVFRVAVPASLPQIFLGLFYGIVSSFATLMAVEMNGNSQGIGWYINWQKSVMMYDGVYAGLIIIAVLCSLILTLLFKVRDKIMVWQKGVIRW